MAETKVTINGETDGGGAWQTWTPTFTGISGATINYAVYSISGKTVHARLKLTMTGANITATTPTFTLPVASASYGMDVMLNSSGMASNLNNVFIPVGAYTNSTTICRWVCLSGSNWANLTPTVPLTWASGNILQVAFSYEAA